MGFTLFCFVSYVGIQISVRENWVRAKIIILRLKIIEDRRHCKDLRVVDEWHLLLELVSIFLWG